MSVDDLGTHVDTAGPAAITSLQRLVDPDLLALR